MGGLSKSKAAVLVAGVLALAAALFILLRPNARPQDAAAKKGLLTPAAGGQRSDTPSAQGGGPSGSPAAVPPLPADEKRGQQRPPSDVLAEFNKVCSSKLDAEGFGIVNIETPVSVTHASGEITVPCHLVIRPGGSISFDDVELKSNKLVISTHESGSASKAVIKNSKMLGVGEAGFLLELPVEGSAITILGSEFVYALGIGIQQKGTLEVQDVIFRSVHDKSEGIRIATSGPGRFERIRAETNSENEALLLADSCTSKQNITGAKVLCLK